MAPIKEELKEKAMYLKLKLEQNQLPLYGENEIQRNSF